MYDKVTMKLFESGFKKFDRMTALGCQQKNIPYDKETCVMAWTAYTQLFIDRGMSPPTSPFTTTV